ncbi:hypothetical protein Q5P01_000505 [Channa striata]|uniref:Uncharacterized protein n=1 Tax=Channa striata TaxID=64152 RepID=A0AA88IGA3_CHASR|nr:hypothetical protein Q5P01_000505 [Channa striata]
MLGYLHSTCGQATETTATPQLEHQQHSYSWSTSYSHSWSTSHHSWDTSSQQQPAAGAPATTTLAGQHSHSWSTTQPATAGAHSDHSWSTSWDSTAATAGAPATATAEHQQLGHQQQPQLGTSNQLTHHPQLMHHQLDTPTSLADTQQQLAGPAPATAGHQLQLGATTSHWLEHPATATAGAPATATAETPAAPQLGTSHSWTPATATTTSWTNSHHQLEHHTTATQLSTTSWDSHSHNGSTSHSNSWSTSTATAGHQQQATAGAPAGNQQWLTATADNHQPQAGHQQQPQLDNHSHSWDTSHSYSSGWSTSCSQLDTHTQPAGTPATAHSWTPA